MKLLVLGATGGTGREIVRQAVTAGHDVVALVRSRASAASALPGAELLEGDARDQAALERALAWCEAVASALGTGLSPFRKVTLLSDSTRALVAAMRQQAVRRLICITGIGAGGTGGCSTTGCSCQWCCGRCMRIRTARSRLSGIAAWSGLSCGRPC